MKWLAVLLVAVASQANSQTFVEKLVDFEVIDCKSQSSGQEMAFAVLRSDKGVKLRPGATDATEFNGILTARYDGGVITIANGQYTFLSPDRLETGACSDLTEVLSATVNEVADAEPGLFRDYVKTSVQTASEKLNFLSEMLAKEKTDLTVSSAKLKSALDRQTTLLQEVGEANAAKARLRLDRDKAVAEAANLKMQLNQSVAFAEVESLRNEIKGLEQEQDRLKRMICKLNPKATFAVCKD